MPRVLTAGGAYHHRCYLHVRQARREPAEAALSTARASGGTPDAGDRLARLLERLAQVVFIVILIGTGLILLEHALP